MKNEIQQALQSLGISKLTPIQEKSIPLILEGKDIIAQAKTGSGKTFAYGIALFSKIDFTQLETKSLILCPTRELADQVATELRKLSRFIKNIKILVICGGVPEYQQIKSLEHKVHIIIGTTGRVLKLLKDGKIQLNKLEMLILDEADRMLQMGFIDDIYEINQQTPKQKQVILFSATFPEMIKQMSQDFQNHPVQIEVDTSHAENIIQQMVFKVQSNEEKLKTILKILAHYKIQTCIIFCQTKVLCEEVYYYLLNHQIAALQLQGDLDQNQRTCVITQFMNGSCSTLVATDVASRGLDMDNLDAVINFNTPKDLDIYTHRIGRTGRAGKNGLAFSLYENHEQDKIRILKDHFKNSILESQLKNLETNSEPFIPLYQTIFINGGKKDKLRPGDILGCLTGEVGLIKDDVGKITILINQSYVAIKKDKLNFVLEKLINTKLKGRKYICGKV